MDYVTLEALFKEKIELKGLKHQYIKARAKAHPDGMAQSYLTDKIKQLQQKIDTINEQIDFLVRG